MDKKVLQQHIDYQMNLAIKGITANLGDKAADTFATDLHSI